MADKGITNLGNVYYNTHKNLWVGIFRDPISKKLVTIKTNKNKEEVIEAVREYIFSFYTTNSYLLPKHISIHNESSQFRFAISINRKTINIGYYKELKDAIEAKNNFILNLFN